MPERVEGLGVRVLFSTFILTAFSLLAFIIFSMSKIKFFHPIEVRYGDLDPQGHLNNAKYLTFFEQARVQYFIHLGMFKGDQSFMDLSEILAEVRVTFLAPVQFNMSIKVGARVSKLGNKSMTIEQSIVNTETEDVLATAEIIMVAYDYHTEKTIPIPDEWRKTIEKFEGLP